MRKHLPPWMRALTAEPGSPEADFDWGEWAADTFRQMRTSWTSYFLVAGLAMAMFSCTSSQMDAQIAASVEREKPSVDPWALEKPAGDAQ
jgi:hypothetical protein